MEGQRVSVFSLISVRHPSINSFRTTVPSSHNHVVTDKSATSANENDPQQGTTRERIMENGSNSVDGVYTTTTVLQVIQEFIGHDSSIRLGHLKKSLKEPPLSLAHCTTPQGD